MVHQYGLSEGPTLDPCYISLDTTFKCSQMLHVSRY
jgi:hypothetical protein